MWLSYMTSHPQNNFAGCILLVFLEAGSEEGIQMQAVYLGDLSGSLGRGEGKAVS